MTSYHIREVFLLLSHPQKHTYLYVREKILRMIKKKIDQKLIIMKENVKMTYVEKKKSLTHINKNLAIENKLKTWLEFDSADMTFFFSTVKPTENQIVTSGNLGRVRLSEWSEERTLLIFKY